MPAPQDTTSPSGKAPASSGLAHVKAAIIGVTGHVGRTVARLLADHPHADMVYSYSRTQGPEGDLDAADFVFLTMPHGSSHDYMEQVDGRRVLDASVDHRLEWAYGIPELFAEQITSSPRVAGPGCYATAVILGAAPLRGLADRIYIVADSGISGAGKDVLPTESTRPYKIGNVHFQLEEMKHVLQNDRILFVPKVLESVYRGICATLIVTGLDGRMDDAVDTVRAAYADSAFVRVVDEPATAHVNGTNQVEIGLAPMPGGELIVNVAIDNLMKGAGGQAVQNMNLMCGLPETAGLV